LSLSLGFRVFTYIVIGLSYSYCDLVIVNIPGLVVPADGKTLYRLCVVSFACLIAFYLVVAVFSKFA